MCQFFSAILTKQGKLLYNFDSMSHEDLITLNDLRDDQVSHLQQRFVRLEFVPDLKQDISKPSAWHLIVDERETPDWFNEKKAREKLWRVIKPIIITDKRTLLVGGHYIFAGEGCVKIVKNVTIFFMCNSSQVGEMWDSSQVGEMYNSSQVGKMWNSSQVGEMWGSSQVGEMWGSSQVGKMCNSSQVGKMCDSSRVGKMWNSSQVGEMWDSSQVGKMRGFSRVGEMYNSSQVGEMRDSSQIRLNRSNKQK